MWRVLVAERFYKDLERAVKGLSKEEVGKLLGKLDELAAELRLTPYPAHKFDLRKVVGKDHLEIRVRIGRFRAVYRVYKDRREIVLVAFFRRDDDSYKRL
jgi:mRNA-degrading endonuclease RelE of RelBE toxin-antitoxin system